MMEPTRNESRTLDGADRLTRDGLFELLSAKRRRDVLAHLRQTSTPVTLDELTEWIVEREAEQSADAASDHHDEIRRSLYHCDLPKLDDAGVVEHDPERNTVEPAANFERVTELSQAVSDVDRARSE